MREYDLTMTFKAMTPAAVCDRVDHFAGLAWPLSAAEVQQGAVERFGWEIEVENGKNYLMDPTSLSAPSDVLVVESGGSVTQVSFRATDKVPDAPGRAALLGDQFAAFVAEGRLRWGTPKIASTSGGFTTATWKLEGGCKTQIWLTAASVSVDVRTPRGVELDGVSLA